MTDKKFKKPIDLEYGKLPPQAIEIERAVLGAFLMDFGNLQKESKNLFDELFYLDVHQRINKAIRNVLEKSGKIDLLTVVEQLKKNEDLETVGGPFYVAQLTSEIGSTAHTSYHIMILFEAYLRRRMIITSTEVIRDSYQDDVDVIELCEMAAQNFNDILSTIQKKKRKSMGDVLKETFEDIGHRITGQRKSMFVTGWTEFDEIVSLDKPRLIVIPSNRKIGKTAFMLALALQIIKHNNNTAWIWFTLEMDAASNIRRFISMLTGLTDDQIQSKGYTLTPEDKDSIKEARKVIKTFNIQFEEECRGILDIKVKTTAFCEEHKNKDCFVVIDNHGYVVNDVREEENICKEYKNLRDSTGACWFVLHHLTTKGNKEFVLTNGYEPSMDMIRGNTRLLDYCNVLLLLHRPDFYKDLMHQMKMELPENLYKMVQKLFLVHCALNRHGETGYIRLQHKIKYSQFKQFTK